MPHKCHKGWPELTKRDILTAPLCFPFCHYSVCRLFITDKSNLIVNIWLFTLKKKKYEKEKKTEHVRASCFVLSSAWDYYNNRGRRTVASERNVRQFPLIDNWSKEGRELASGNRFEAWSHNRLSNCGRENKWREGSGELKWLTGRAFHYWPHLRKMDGKVRGNYSGFYCISILIKDGQMEHYWYSKSCHSENNLKAIAGFPDM